MRRFKITMGAGLLCIMLFSACGRGNETNGDTSQYIPQYEETAEETDGITTEQRYSIPHFMTIPENDGGISINVDGRTVTFSIDLATYDGYDLTVLVFEGGEGTGRSEVFYTELVRYESPFSHTFTLRDDIPHGVFALVIGGEGAQFPIRSDFEIR